MISIVMPVRNAEPFLEECLLSIVNQSFTNWQLIAINDHSIDNSLAILSAFAAKDSRIIVLENTGKGIIDALNLAYSKTTGTAISRMDADDIMPEYKLEKMYAALIQHPNALITGYVHYIAETKVNVGFKNYEKWLNLLVDNQNHYQEIYKECVIASPCWIVNKSVFEHCGAFKSNIYPEDYDLCFRFYQNQIPIIALPEVLHIWRDHNMRASRTDSNYADNAFTLLKINYFLKLDFDIKRILVLWGAGKKAKKIAQYLLENDIKFIWSCNNHKKIGHTVYGQKVEDISKTFSKNANYQCLMTIANKEEQDELKNQLKQQQNIQAFWFC